MYAASAAINIKNYIPLKKYSDISAALCVDRFSDLLLEVLFDESDYIPFGCNCLSGNLHKKRVEISLL